MQNKQYETKAKAQKISKKLNWPLCTQDNFPNYFAKHECRVIFNDEFIWLVEGYLVNYCFALIHPHIKCIIGITSYGKELFKPLEIPKVLSELDIKIDYITSDLSPKEKKYFKNHKQC